MRNVRSLNIKYRISTLATFLLACNTISTVMKYCGRVVQGLVQNKRISSVSFAHNPPHTVYSFLNTFLCTVYARITHQLLHTYFMQYQSVSSMLYAQSTGPTITTTYI